MQPPGEEGSAHSVQRDGLRGGVYEGGRGDANDGLAGGAVHDDLDVVSELSIHQRPLGGREGLRLVEVPLLLLGDSSVRLEETVRELAAPLCAVSRVSVVVKQDGVIVPELAGCLSHAHV